MVCKVRPQLYTYLHNYESDASIFARSKKDSKGTHDKAIMHNAKLVLDPKPNWQQYCLTTLHQVYHWSTVDSNFYQMCKNYTRWFH